jgi:pimeloyl-ACP methyl ester carboxylesterase
MYRILLAFLLCCMIVPPTFAQTDFTPHFETAPCMETLPEHLVEGEDVECGYLIVPEEHENPSGPTIRLAVAIFHSPNPNPAPDPLVLLQGGPGSSTISTYFSAFAGNSNNPILAQRDVILLEERGTYHTEPSLDCPEFLEQELQELVEDISGEESLAQSLEVATVCHDRLLAEGYNLNAYDSYESAADVAALPQVLGYESYNLYGVSYGTKLAQFVMDTHPEGLRSVILDAVVDPTSKLFFQLLYDAQTGFDKLFATCASDAVCSTVFPDLETTFYDLVASLNEQPITFELTNPLTEEPVTVLFNGDKLVRLTFQLLYVTLEIPLLPRMIYELQDGKTDLVKAGLLLMQFDDVFRHGMYYSVNCADESGYEGMTENMEGVRPEIQRVLSSELDVDICQMWNVESTGAEAEQPVVSDIPTLLFSGAFDPVTPAYNAENVASNLSNSFQFVFPSAGHGTLITLPCATDMAVAFLDDPSISPDASCVDDLQPFFLGDLTRTGVELVPFTSDDGGFSGLRPADWQEEEPGVYNYPSIRLVHRKRDDGLTAYLQFLQESNHLPELPQVVDTLDVNGKTWNLYHYQAFDLRLADLAIYEPEAGGTIYVVLVSSYNEGDQAFLYENVLLPAVQGFEVIQ